MRYSQAYIQHRMVRSIKVIGTSIGGHTKTTSPFHLMTILAQCVPIDCICQNGPHSHSIQWRSLSRIFWTALMDNRGTRTNCKRHTNTQISKVPLVHPAPCHPTRRNEFLAKVAEPHIHILNIGINYSENEVLVQVRGAERERERLNGIQKIQQDKSKSKVLLFIAHTPERE